MASLLCESSLQFVKLNIFMGCSNGGDDNFTEELFNKLPGNHNPLQELKWRSVIFQSMVDNSRNIVSTNVVRFVMGCTHSYEMHYKWVAIPSIGKMDKLTTILHGTYFIVFTLFRQIPWFISLPALWTPQNGQNDSTMEEFHLILP